MKGPLSADRLYFISALVSVVGFILYSILNLIWPLPPAAMVPMPASANAVNMVSWLLSIAGVLTFFLGILASRK